MEHNFNNIKRILTWVLKKDDIFTLLMPEAISIFCNMGLIEIDEQGLALDTEDNTMNHVSLTTYGLEVLSSGEL